MDASGEDWTRGLREFMARHRLDQRGLAEGSGVHEVSISRLFNHGSDSKRSTIERILRYCRTKEPAITYEQLFGGAPAATTSAAVVELAS